MLKNWLLQQVLTIIRFNQLANFLLLPFTDSVHATVL